MREGGANPEAEGRPQGGIRKTCVRGLPLGG